MVETRRRTAVRLLLAVALGSAAFLIPGRSSSGYVLPRCQFECWDSTYVPPLKDCVSGPPATCLSCIDYCPAPV
jgi:hypothetical protein